MKYAFQAVTCITALLVAGACQAQAQVKPLYAEIAVASIKYEEAGYSLTPVVLRAIPEYEAHPNVAFEGMLGFGLVDGTLRASGYTFKGKVDSTIGLIVRPKVDVSPALEIYGRLGFAKSSVTGSAVGFSRALSSSDSDLVYGAGASFRLSPTLSIVGDYMTYYNKNGVTAGGVSVGLRTQF